MQGDAEIYLRQKTKEIPQNELVKKLAVQGFAPPFVYDHHLFKALNKIYEDKPLVPRPREISPKSLFSQADQRVNYLQKLFGNIEGKNCLEIGCGRGETSVRLSEQFSSCVTGVDIQAYPEWTERQNDRVRFMEVDLTEQKPFSPESFDYIVSFAVLEHVQKPLVMLEAMFELLKPGGGDLPDSQPLPGTNGIPPLSRSFFSLATFTF